MLDQDQDQVIQTVTTQEADLGQLMLLTMVEYTMVHMQLTTVEYIQQHTEELSEEYMQVTTEEVDQDQLMV